MNDDAYLNMFLAFTNKHSFLFYLHFNSNDSVNLSKFEQVNSQYTLT